MSPKNEVNNSKKSTAVSGKPTSKAGTRTKSKTIGSRFGILISILEYLSVHKQVTVGELSKLFGLESSLVLRELELVACCGVKPFTPDSLLDIEIDLPYLNMDNFDGDLEGVMITANIEGRFNQAHQFESQDLLLLEQLQQTLMNLPGFEGSGVLESAIEKILKLPTNAFKIQMRPAKFKEVITRAIADKKQLKVTYFSKYTDKVSEKKIAPLLQKFVEGNWYLYAVDTKDNTLKSFKNERILSLTISNTGFRDNPEIKNQLAILTDRSYNPNLIEATRVVLKIHNDFRWILEAIIFENIIETSRDHTIFDLYVTDRQWLASLLLAYAELEVVEPQEFKELPIKLAKTLLKSYKKT